MNVKEGKVVVTLTTKIPNIEGPKRQRKLLLAQVYTTIFLYITPELSRMYISAR